MLSISYKPMLQKLLVHITSQEPNNAHLNNPEPPVFFEIFTQKA